MAIFSFSASSQTYQYECISVSGDGYITIKIWNPQKGKHYTSEQARKDAIHAILFSGILSNHGCISQKPILQSQEARDNFNKMAKEFFKTNGDWGTNTRASDTETALPESLGTKDWKVYQISVAKNFLRKYLEDKEIIKPLNNGF
jgi:hypothetical protein